MGVGISMFAEVYPSWTVRPIAVCLTPGGVFLFHNRTLFKSLGLVLERNNNPLPLVPCRGWPEGVSQEVVDVAHICISDSAPKNRKQKNLARHHSPADEQAWLDWGLKIVEVPNLEHYTFEVPGGAKCIFDPGCEKPSWLTAKELSQSLIHSGYDIDDPEDDDNEKHNACIFRWIRDLGTVHGEDNVRIVYWFDSVGQEFL